MGAYYTTALDEKMGLRLTPFFMPKMPRLVVVFTLNFYSRKRFKEFYLFQGTRPVEMKRRCSLFYYSRGNAGQAHSHENGNDHNKWIQKRSQRSCGMEPEEGLFFYVITN
jgi:hypothetical protein